MTDNIDLRAQIDQRAPVIYGQIDDGTENDLLSPVYLNDSIYIYPMKIGLQKTWLFAVIFPKDFSGDSLLMRYDCVPASAEAGKCSSDTLTVSLEIPKSFTAQHAYHYRFMRSDKRISLLKN
jgi:hypothetical protein